MFLLCAALTVMQYRWTGEVARAEAVRLRGKLDEQAQGVARAFDAELSSSCDQLIPQRQGWRVKTLTKKLVLLPGRLSQRSRQWVESLFGGRERLGAILDELNQLITLA
jgi:hypothetical protein